MDGGNFSDTGGPRPGTPAKPDRKVDQTLRLDPDVVAAYRREGPGWQAPAGRRR